MLLTICANNAVQAASPARICGRYSSFLLAPGDKAEVIGAGADSVSLLVTGASGAWIYYDALVPQDSSVENDTKVYASPGSVAYRRDHDARIYVVRSPSAGLVGQKRVQVGVMGVDLMRRPLFNPAIVGNAADIAILKRIFPANVRSCALRWIPGKGLVK